MVHHRLRAIESVEARRTGRGESDSRARSQARQTAMRYLTSDDGSTLWTTAGPQPSLALLLAVVCWMVLALQRGLVESGYAPMAECRATCFWAFSVDAQLEDARQLRLDVRVSRTKQIVQLINLAEQVQISGRTTSDGGHDGLAAADLRGDSIG